MSAADERNARVISDQLSEINRKLDLLLRLLMVDPETRRAVRLDVMEGRLGTLSGLLEAQGQMFATRSIPRDSGPTE